MKVTIYCATLALLAWQGWAGNVAPIAIYTGFENEPSTLVFESFRNEVNSLMAPLKVPLEWRLLAKQDLDDPATELAVVTFKGICDPGDSAFQRRGMGPLAWTHVTDGVVLPFADVDCARVHELMEKSLTGIAPGKREAIFGRALGRVVTHELYHIFTGTRHHTTDDVAHPVYTAQDLVTDRFQFGLQELNTLRRSLTPVLRALRLSKGVPLRSPQAGRSMYELSSCASCHGAGGEGTSSAPALRALGKPVESKAFSAKLAKDIGHMYRGSGNQKVAPALNDDDIDDIVSYLNSLESTESAVGQQENRQPK